VADLTRIFEPITLGKVEMRNRIVMTGHGTAMARSHLPSEQHAAYYAERSRGGVALIGMAFPQIHPSSQNVPGEVRAYLPEVVPGLKRITEAVHEYGAKIVMQLEPDEAERVIADGHADMVAMTRQHIADPETVNKLREGRHEDIRRCIGCNQGYLNRLFKITHTTCVLDKLGVDIRRGESAAREDVLALDPDEIVVATGSAPERAITGNLSHGITTVPGLESDHVLTVWDVLEHGSSVGSKVLVVDDGEGGWKGISVALELADAGHEVHFSTPLPYVGSAIGPFSQNKLIPRIFEAES
jgi:hypothetical protein